MPVDVTLWGRPDTKAEVLRIVRQSGYIVYEGLSQVPAQSAAVSFSNSSVLNVPARRTFLSPTEVILCEEFLLNCLCFFDDVDCASRFCCVAVLFYIC